MITYKLFRVKQGQLYPLYVNANKPVPLGVWLKAEAGERTPDGKVKSRLGKLAYRPDNQVWCECEVSTAVDYTSEAGKHGLKRIPKNGGYWFKTNSNMIGRWYISGELKVNKILTDSEVNAINKKDGVFDLPRKGIVIS